MTPRFHPSMVNGPFDDPALYVDFLHERRALLFDLGDIAALPPRKILRISHVFVSHAHIDHFIGFDHLIRICLGREKVISLYGPPGFVDQVEHRLASYTWNLVENYPTDFTVIAGEYRSDGTVAAAAFHCLRRFAREAAPSAPAPEGVLHEEETFRVRCSMLDHRTTSLGFVLEEKQHVNILKNRVDELGLPTGPWLAELKRSVLRGDVDDRPFHVRWREGPKDVERTMNLRDLAERVASVVPGQKVAYVTDVVFSEENAHRIRGLAAGADYLFIEAMFLHEEAERAREKWHLTAHQAGLLARSAGVARVFPFHFSAKYKGEGARLEEECLSAFVAG